ncbi:MAG: MFS transporter, partial [Acidimicrobiia bacterium]|nr:MFS transporter [Acidimicrobiia bacterium]
GGAGIWITAPGLATAEVPPERRGTVIGLCTASVGFGTSMVALGTRLARSATGDDQLWRPIFGIEALATAAILTLIVAAVRPARTPGLGGGFSLRALRRVPSWRRVTIAYVLFGGVAAGYSSFLAEALEEDGGLSRSAVGLVYIGMGFSSLLGAPAVGWLSDRRGRRAAFLTVVAGLCVGSFVIALGSGLLVAGAALLLGGMWSSYPTLTATYVRDHLDAREFGSAFGAMTVFYGLFAIFPPLFAGVIADRLGGFRVPYVAIGALCLACGAVLWSLPAETRPGLATAAGSGPAASTEPGALRR